MRCKKTLTTIVALAMIISAFVVVYKVTDFKLVDGASATEFSDVPGVNTWEGNISLGGGILNMTEGQKSNIKVGNDVTLYFNGTLIDESTYVYYPVYRAVEDSTNGTYEVYCNWTRYSGTPLSASAVTPSMQIKFTDSPYAGMWILVGGSASKLWLMNMSDRKVNFPITSSNEYPIKGWFWVNSSSAYSVQLSKTSVGFKHNETLTVTVKDSNSDPVSQDLFIDVWNVYNIGDDGTGIHRLAYHKYLPASAGGVWTINNDDTDGDTINMHDITGNLGAGTYQIRAYRDVNPGTDGLNEARMIYSNGASGADYSQNGVCGWNNTFGQTDSVNWSGRFVKSGTGGDTNIRSCDGDTEGTNTVNTTWWQSPNGCGTTYEWYSCGPFNPPEYLTTYQNLTVNSGTPSITITNGTQFWNDSATQEVKLIVKQYDGSNLTASSLTVQLFNSQNRPSRATSNAISSENLNITYGSDSNSAIVYITANNSFTNRWGWNANGTWAAKGKVYIVVRYNSVGNATEEWNGTAEMTLTTATNRFVWVNDGSTGGAEITDGELGSIPAVNSIPVNIQFRIQGSDYYYFGDTSHSGSCFTVQQCAENITIGGDSLFAGTLNTMPNYNDSGYYNSGTGTWTVPIIPLMDQNGGAISITANAWNATISDSLSIGGTNYWQNGTIVSVTPNRFDIDVENKTLDITVTTAAGVNLPGCTVYLYYIDDTDFGAHSGPMDGSGQRVDIITSDANGEYNLHFNTTQQTTNQSATSGMSPTGGKAPRNLTVYAVSGSGSSAMYGYGLVRMDGNSDLEVDISKDTMLAGYRYEEFYINCTFAGNSTDAPSTATADLNAFKFLIYDSDHVDVTSTVLSGGTYGTSDLSGSNVGNDYGVVLYDLYITNPGTYTIYCKNNTHDSEGYNATLTVEQVDVASTITPLIWKHDENITATFTCTRGGEEVEGSLLIDNLTDIGDWNQTWKNTSFDGTADQGGNTSITLSYSLSQLVGGIGTVYDITSNYLEATKAEQNITFWFRPVDENGVDGEWARANGNLPISVPAVSPSPSKIPLGRTSTVNIEVTGRGTKLSGVFVGLDGAGISIATTNTTSNTDGQAQFSISPSSTGNISIHVGQENRIVTQNIVVTGWTLNLVLSTTTVDEGGTFTVTAYKEGTTTPVNGAVITIQGIDTVTTGTDGVATFTAPGVSSDRTYTVTGSAEGYAPDSDTVQVTVINIPKLTIVASKTEVKGGETFTVTVAEDTGKAVIGATVTFAETTYKTGAGGTVTITAPSGVTDEAGKAYTITATFSGFQDADAVTITVFPPPGTPGFELLTLIIAIGVAFILLRRRRHK
jgi:hypothetical protein